VEHNRRDVSGNLYLTTISDGTMSWTAPTGQTYTTYSGSRLLCPQLCKATAPVGAPVKVPSDEPSRGLMMPRRKHTREDNRCRCIDAERRLNDEYVAERSKPPPF